MCLQWVLNQLQQRSMYGNETLLISDAAAVTESLSETVCVCAMCIISSMGHGCAQPWLCIFLCMPKSKKTKKRRETKPNKAKRKKLLATLTVTVAISIAISSNSTLHTNKKFSVGFANANFWPINCYQFFRLRSLGDFFLPFFTVSSEQLKRKFGFKIWICFLSSIFDTKDANKYLRKFGIEIVWCFLI